MRKPVIAGVSLFAFIIIASTSKAQALEPSQLLALEKPNTNSSLSSIISKDLLKTDTDSADKAADQTKSDVVQYAVVEGDSLSIIATKFNTTWERLYDKNTQIAQPDIIKVNDTITIPKSDETLTERPKPVAPAPAPVHASASASPSYSSARTSTAATYSGSASSAGNTYSYGYCTWYVKNRRPDLPNNLGNADTWVARAAAQGYATGPTPRVGAVGQAGMHVVYVEAVNGDGTVTISEYNHAGWNVYDTRTVSAGSFYYIY